MVYKRICWALTPRHFTVASLGTLSAIERATQTVTVQSVSSCVGTRTILEQHKLTVWRAQTKQMELVV